jgi:hypothetical protein
LEAAVDDKDQVKDGTEKGAEETEDTEGNIYSPGRSGIYSPGRSGATEPTSGENPTGTDESGSEGGENFHPRPFHPRP